MELLSTCPFLVSLYLTHLRPKLVDELVTDTDEKNLPVVFAFIVSVSSVENVIV